MNVLLNLVLTEKSFDLLEKENKLVFAVDMKATKIAVKDAVEAAYGVQVESVNTVNEFKRGKKAIVKLKEGSDAGKVVSDLGLM